MLRTRAAILDAAAACIERGGVRSTTMSEIAAAAGVAKATLYNHFRTKSDVLAALVEARAEALAEQSAAIAAGPPDHAPDAAFGLAAALEHAAGTLAATRALRRVAAQEPALLAALAAPGAGRGWEQVRTGVAGVLAAGGAAASPEATDLVLRWLLSQLLWPAPPEAARADAAVLVRALARVPDDASPVPQQGRSWSRPASDGLGWPGEPARLRTR